MRRLLSMLLLLPLIANATPQIETWQTDNGLPVWFVPAMSVPMVDIELVFDAGSRRDATLSGIANFVSAMIEEGTAKWSADEVAQQFESLGAITGFNASRDMATVSLRSLAEENIVSQAVSQMAALLQGANFPPEALERVRQQILTSIEMGQQNPASILSDAFYRHVYADHPYATPVVGEASSVKALQQPQLLDFYRHHYSVSHGLMVIVGALSTAEAKRYANRLAQPCRRGSRYRSCLWSNRSQSHNSTILPMRVAKAT